LSEITLKSTTRLVRKFQTISRESFHQVTRRSLFTRRPLLLFESSESDLVSHFDNLVESHGDRYSWLKAPNRILSSHTEILTLVTISNTEILTPVTTSNSEIFTLVTTPLNFVKATSLYLLTIQSYLSQEDNTEQRQDERRT
jgi:hypothetical protein